MPLGDKSCHYAFMFTFSMLTNLALRCLAIHLGGRTLLLGTLIVTMVVVAEEFSQLWIPGRDFDLLDLAADLVGIACGGADREESSRRASSNRKSRTCDPSRRVKCGPDDCDRPSRRGQGVARQV